MLNLRSDLWVAFDFGLLSFAIVLSKNRRDWISLTNASALFDQTSATLDNTFGDDLLADLIGHSKIPAFFALASKSAKALNIAQIDKHALFHVVLTFDGGPPPPASLEAEIAIKYWTFGRVLEVGGEHQKDLLAMDPDAYYLISYWPGKPRSTI